MAIQLSGSLAITGSLTTSTTIGAQGAINVTNATNPVSFTSTASLYSDGGVRFTKDMYVSGTAYFNNVTVFGTQSIAYISSSQLNIGTNLITVNTDTPTVRFGGLAVYDSGSTGLTGSLFWDSENNHWVYSNPSGSSYSGGMFISGPRSAALGSEQGTTACALMMGQGGDHITSSAIFHYGNSTCFYGQSFISSSGNACFSGQVCSNTVSTTDGTNTSTLANNYLRYNGGDFYVDACAVGGNFRIRTSNASALDSTALFVCGGNSRIGIGTTTPYVNLHVLGTIKVATGNAQGILGLGEANGTTVNVGLWRGAANAPTSDGNYLNLGGYDGIVLATGNAAIGSQTERVRLDTSGNLMVGSISAGNAGTINVSVGCAGTTAGGLQLWAATNQTHYVQFGDGTAGGAPYAGYVAYAHATDTLSLGTATATRAIITSTGIACFSNTVCTPMILASGCVGIGTTSPNRPLTVATCTDGGCINTGCTFLENAYFGNGGLTIGQQSFTLHTALMTNGSDKDILFGGWGGGCNIERMRITSAGNVGIGTTTADVTGFGWKTLTIKGGTTAGDAGVLELQNTQTNANNQNLGLIAFLDGTSRNAQIGAKRETSTSCSYLDFYTNAGSGIVERMRITSGGNVGIGTTNPGYKLDVCREGSGIVGRFGKETIFGEWYVDGQRVGLQGTRSSDSAVSGFYIENPTNTGTSNFELLSFKTIGSEKMRITNCGYVGMLQTSPDTTLDIGNTTNQAVWSSCSSCNANLGENFENNIIIQAQHAPGANCAYGYPASNLVFRTSNASNDIWNVGAIQGVVDPFGGSYYQGGLVFLTKPSANDCNPIGRKTQGGPLVPILALGQNASNTRIAYFNSSVGIGTASPAEKFVVSETSNPSQITLKQETNFNLGIIGQLNYIGGGIGSKSAMIESNRIGGSATNAYRGGDLRFYTKVDDTFDCLVERMRIASAGNVGIGITDPGAKLQVKTSVSAGATDAFYIENPSSALFEVRDDGLTYMKGCVGIGTTSPSQLVEIQKDQAATTTLLIRNVNDQANAATEIRLYGNEGIAPLKNNQQISFVRGSGGADWALGQPANSSDFVIAGGTNQGDGKPDLGTAERMRITSTGIACFACRVCAPAATISTYLNAQQVNGDGVRTFFNSYCVSQAVPNLAANNGIIVVRDHVVGGTGAWILDPNMGVISLGSNIPNNVSFTYSGCWQWCITCGSLNRCLSYGFYGA